MKLIVGILSLIFIVILLHIFRDILIEAQRELRQWWYDLIDTYFKK